jgi:hypothetical protein
MSMNVIYHVMLDDPSSGRTRQFSRDAGQWPFPCLPAPGDAVTIDVVGRWETVSGEGDTALNEWVHPRSLQPRKVQQVIYDQAVGVAHILFPVTGLNDPQPQIQMLLNAGFKEVSGQSQPPQTA